MQLREYRQRGQHHYSEVKQFPHKPVFFPKLTTSTDLPEYNR
jgi:hypothetical protein